MFLFQYCPKNCLVERQLVRSEPHSGISIALICDTKAFSILHFPSNPKLFGESLTLKQAKLLIFAFYFTRLQLLDPAGHLRITSMNLFFEYLTFSLNINSCSYVRIVTEIVLFYISHCFTSQISTMDLQIKCQKVNHFLFL